MPTRIVVANFDDPRVVDMLQRHSARARAETALGSSHALDLAALQAADVVVWTLWHAEASPALLGIAALKRLSMEHGEIKSMYVEADARGRGAGGALLAHLVTAARERGLTRLSLETGAWPYFDPARAFYRRHGFVVCAPFASYREDPNSVFMTLDLEADPAGVSTNEGPAG